MRLRYNVSMSIKNIVFDIGNVMLIWDPQKVVASLFPAHEPKALSSAIFRSEIWFDLNKGFISESEAINLYLKNNVPLNHVQLEELMFSIKESLLPVEGSLELLNTLHQRGIPLYSITDNVKEIMSYLKIKYNFWEKFYGVVVSADIGCLKPAAEIYLHLLNTYRLNPSETVFFDDLLLNVEGAKKVGMHAFQFVDVQGCENDLRQLQLHA